MQEKGLTHLFNQLWHGRLYKWRFKDPGKALCLFADVSLRKNDCTKRVWYKVIDLIGLPPSIHLFKLFLISLKQYFLLLAVNTPQKEFTRFSARNRVLAPSTCLEEGFCFLWVTGKRKKGEKKEGDEGDPGMELASESFISPEAQSPQCGKVP